MKKCALALVFLVFIIGPAQALELSFRTGSAVRVKNWDETQFKVGFNLAHIGQERRTGFFYSTTADIGFLNDTITVWLVPELQYDIRFNYLPLAIYPKIGLIGLFAYLEDRNMIGMGLKPSIGIKTDLRGRFFVYGELIGFNMLFFRNYFDYPANSMGKEGTKTNLAMSYEIMFGIGYRFYDL